MEAAAGPGTSVAIATPTRRGSGRPEKAARVAEQRPSVPTSRSMSSMVRCTPPCGSARWSRRIVGARADGDRSRSRSGWPGPHPPARSTRYSSDQRMRMPGLSATCAIGRSNSGPCRRSARPASAATVGWRLRRRRPGAGSHRRSALMALGPTLSEAGARLRMVLGLTRSRQVSRGTGPGAGPGWHRRRRHPMITIFMRG